MHSVMNVAQAGRLGGLARKKKLSKKRRIEIAKLAARIRWQKRKKKNSVSNSRK